MSGVRETAAVSVAQPMPRIVRADAGSLPLANNSVDVVITSPPCYGLRLSQDGGRPYANQIGAESTPAEYLDALLGVTRECVRVLKPTGSIFVDLGDWYSTSNSGESVPAKLGKRGRRCVRCDAQAKWASRRTAVSVATSPSARSPVPSSSTRSTPRCSAATSCRRLMHQHDPGAQPRRPSSVRPTHLGPPPDHDRRYSPGPVNTINCARTRQSNLRRTSTLLCRWAAIDPVEDQSS